MSIDHFDDEMDNDMPDEFEHSDDTDAFDVSEEDEDSGEPEPNELTRVTASLVGKSKGEALGQVISTPELPNFFKLEFRLKPGKHVHPGKWVLVETPNAEGKNVFILGRVLNAHQFNPHEDALSSNIREKLPFVSTYANEESSTVIYRLVDVELLQEAQLDAQGSITGFVNVETLALSGQFVFEAGGELTNQALGLAGPPPEGLHMGTYYGSGDPFVLRKEIIQRHVFISGGIGSGKSYTRGKLGEELHKWGVPQENEDVMGEMVIAAEELGGKNLVPGEGEFTLPLSALTAKDVLDAVPSIDQRSVMAELVRHAHETLLKDSLKTGRHFGIDDLVTMIEKVAPDLDAKAASYRPAMSRVQNLERLPYIGTPFNWRKALKPGAFINIDCSGMLVSDLRIIVASIARDLQRLARSRDKIPFVAFSIDEAHLIVPAAEDTVCLQVMRELARIGRHYRIGLILSTQSPQDMDKSVLKRLLTRFLHAIEPDQLDSLRGVFSDASQELVRQLPKMPQGVCIVTGAYETIRHATMIRVGQRETTHGGSTPDIFADLAVRGWQGKRATEIIAGDEAQEEED